jgi:hypothetical protein
MITSCSLAVSSTADIAAADAPLLDLPMQQEQQLLLLPQHQAHTLGSTSALLDTCVSAYHLPQLGPQNAL